MKTITIRTFNFAPLEMGSVFFLLLSLVFLPAIATAGDDVVVYTDTATFAAEGQLPAVGPPVPLTSLISLSDTGRSYTNSIGPAAASNEVRIVGATLVGSARHGTGMQTAAPIGPGGGALVALFGMQGIFTTTDDIRVDAGRMRILELPIAAAFIADDPTTWSAGATLLADYRLSAPVIVIDGGSVGALAGIPEPIDLPASDTNVGGANSAVGATSQLLMHFFEQSPADDLLNTDSGLAALLGGNVREGALVDLDRELIEPGMTGLDMMAQTELNAIAMASFGDSFADFGSGGFLDYTPETTGPMVTDTDGTGFDLVANLGGNLAPTITAVPEPATCAMLVTMTFIGAWMRRRTT